MTQNQLEWMQQSGLDPAEYDMTPDGRVIRRQPVQAPVEPQREVMSPLRAAGTSFLGNVLPSAASLGGAKLGMMAGAPFGPVGVGIGAIGGGLGAGYLTGKGQEAVLEKVAPEALQQLAQAEQDQPVASYLGGFAPNALAFRPSVQGMSGLLRPTVRGTETLREALSKPEFLAPAANIAANVAGSTAGQLVNMSQGGEFSAPRFAADVALGTLFNRPTAIGRRFGFQDIPEPRREAPGDLAAARERAEFMEYPPQDFVTPREERLDLGAEEVAPEQFFTPEGKRMTEKAMARDYTNWWKSETEPTTDLIKGAAEEIKMKVPKERLAELAQDPEVGAALRDPSRMPAFIAKQADQALEDVYQMMLRAETKGKFATAEEAANQRALQELRAEKGLPSETALSDVEAAYAEANKTATDAAREIYTRLQRAPEEYTGKITQEDINLATEIANRRGLKIELDRAYAGDQQVRGLFMVDPNTGDRIIRVNPLMATPDTAIHEIGHDVFKGVTNKGMRRSLLDTALNSPAYKAELAARAEEVKAGKLSEQEANDIALEEGLIQAFGEQMPSVKRSELRAWYQAFKASMKQLVTGKMSPEDALAWMHYATTEAVPWKGVAVAKVGDQPDTLSKDIRYQRSLGSEIVKPSELDYLASKGGPFADVAMNVKAAYNTRDFKAGEWSSKYSLAAELRPEDQKRLFMHLSQEFDNNTRSTPPADLRAAYDQIRNEYLPAIVNDYNAAGMTVRDTAGLRARGSNPTYIPLHAIAEEVKNILTTKQGSPEYDKLKNDFLQWNTQLRQADGASLAEAQKYALDKFEEKINITSKPPGIESGIPFSGARKPEGYPLPPSWRSDDLIGNLDNYTRRSATDYAYQKHVESSPEAMAALGAKNYFNDVPIPANVLASTPNIINEPSVQSILREYRGTPAQKVGGNLTDLGKAVSVATIGPVSKVGDIGTSLVKGLVYLPAGEYTAGLVDFTNRLGDWAALKERSYASGLNRRDAAQNMRQVLGIGDDSVSFMAKAAETLSKFTGLNQLETVARTIAQGWGETVVKYNKRLALSGDKNATQMLDTLSPDWRTRSDADLAAQVGRLLQGSYDMRQLPASVLEGAAAPYLTWSKWSIGQYDSFVKYALQPAMQGNVKPLIGQMLIGVLGGGAVSAVQEWINNREGKDITWNELESWMQENQGQLGADGGQLLGQKLLTMAQKLGTFGFAGDIAKMAIDTAAGGTAQGVATMPALDAVYDISKRVAAATKALDDGEDFGLVLKALLQDSVIGHLQVARLARNWLDEDENLRYDDRRRRRLYDELTGMPSRGGAFAVNYSNLSEREFERGEITPQTGEEALSLVMRAKEQATTPEDYASRIRKLKTSQNAIMPSLERQPLKAARYLSWLEGTEEGLGSETVKRYLIREQEDKYRKSLVEGLSGLR